MGRMALSPSRIQTLIDELDEMIACGLKGVTTSDGKTVTMDEVGGLKSRRAHLAALLAGGSRPMVRTSYVRLRDPD